MEDTKKERWHQGPAPVRQNEELTGMHTLAQNLTMAKIGSIGWIDLTVENAENISTFYQSVVGWNAAPVEMGEYHDYNMTGPENGTPYAGVCHARGLNQGIPCAWMIYIHVADLDASMAACTANGGKVLGAERSMGSYGRYCFIEDPAGAVAALFEEARVDQSNG